MASKEQNQEKLNLNIKYNELTLKYYKSNFTMINYILSPCVIQ